VTYLLDNEEKVKKIRVNNCFDRVLFATDYPGPLYYGISLERIVKRIKANPFLSSKEKYAILGGNAKRILKLS
jgi:predicted TIM-barrel fold metal-dependent hydrolase